MNDFVCHWVDAFTDQPFGGNGCAVVQDAAHLDTETCLAFVRETSLVECTFLGPSDVADLQVRYFLASREIPFAGHPTVASVIAAHAAGKVGTGPLTLETGAGIMPVTLSGDGKTVTMLQNAPEFGPEVDPKLVADTIGLPADALGAVPQVVSTGLPFVIALIKDPVQQSLAQLNVGALERMRATLDVMDADVMEPFIVTLGGATPQGDTFARLLLAPPNPAEDPFTGSATGAMAAYLWAKGLIDSPAFVAEQGHQMGRPGRAEVRILGPRDAITGVEVVGKGHILMSGHLHL